jgi:predicted CoA-binding protein
MKTVAILGASTNPEKFGHRAVLAFADAGFTVYPVNPRAEFIAALRCFPDLASLPGRPDVVSAYLPPEVLVETLPAVAEVGCYELWLNPGTDTAEVLERARSLGLNTVSGCSLVALAGGRLRVADE